MSLLSSASVCWMSCRICSGWCSCSVSFPTDATCRAVHRVPPGRGGPAAASAVRRLSVPRLEAPARAARAAGSGGREQHTAKRQPRRTARSSSTPHLLPLVTTQFPLLSQWHRLYQVPRANYVIVPLLPIGQSTWCPTHVRPDRGYGARAAIVIGLHLCTTGIAADRHELVPTEGGVWLTAATPTS
jgi:hypothetical protein